LHACVFVHQTYEKEERRTVNAVAKCMQLIVDHGGRVDLKDEDGRTPVDLALTIARKRKGLGWSDPRLKPLGITTPKPAASSARARPKARKSSR